MALRGMQGHVLAAWVKYKPKPTSFPFHDLSKDGGFLSVFICLYSINQMLSCMEKGKERERERN